jgi:NADH-quinone oxidoreductase subunit A
MLNNYVPILIIMSFAVIMAIAFVVISKVIGPKNPNPVKLSTYESGMEPVGTARTRFSVKYYMAAMLFIIFDIEIVFMYPWAVTFRSFGGYYMTYALIEMIVFIGILLIGYFYMLRKGALKWD